MPLTPSSGWKTPSSIAWGSNGGTAPAINSGALAARYLHTAENQLCVALTATMGVDTVFGDAGKFWTFYLRYAGDEVADHVTKWPLIAQAYDSSAVLYYYGNAQLKWTGSPAGVQLTVWFNVGATGVSSAAEATIPFVWAPGDQLVIANAIEAFGN